MDNFFQKKIGQGQKIFCETLSGWPGSPGVMAGIIAQLTRSARERSLRKNYGANK